MRALILALFLLLPAHAAWSATCTFNTGAVNWSAITDAAAVDCGSPTSSDDFVVPDGSTVTITGDITGNAAASNSIVVQSGGTLIQNSHSIVWGQGVTSDMTGTSGSSGRAIVEVEVGGTYTLNGCYRISNRYTGGCETTLDLTRHIWRAGGIDFSAGDILVTYSDTYDNDEPCTAQDLPQGCPTVVARLSDIVVGDLVVPIGTSGAAGLWFEVTAIDTFGPDYSITLASRQTDENYTKDTIGYTLAKRAITSLTPTGTILRGQTCVDVNDGVITLDNHYSGRSVRHVATNQTFTIMDSFVDTDCAGVATGGADSIVILNEEGFAFDITSGNLEIGYGWRRGDSFLVMDPARVVNNAPTASGGDDEADASVFIKGTINATAAQFSRIGGLWVGSTMPGPTGGIIGNCQDVLFRDSGVRVSAVVRLDSMATPVDCTRLLMSGGNDDPSVGGTGTHGIVLSNDPSHLGTGVPSAPFTCTDCAAAFHQDDAFGVSQASTDPDIANWMAYGRLTLSRYKCLHVNQEGESVSCIDIANEVNNAGGGRITNTLLRNGSQSHPRGDTPGSDGAAIKVRGANAGGVTVDGVAVVGGRRTTLLSHWSTTAWVKNVYAAGVSAETPGAYIIGSLTDSYLRGFEFLDTTGTECVNTSNSIFGKNDQSGSPLATIFGARMRKSRISDAEVRAVSFVFAKTDAPLLLHDNVFQDIWNDCDGSSSGLVKVNNSSTVTFPDMDVYRNNFVWTGRREAGFRRMVTLQSVTASFIPSPGTWRFSENVLYGNRCSYAGSCSGSYVYDSTQMSGFSSYESNQFGNNGCGTGCTDFDERGGGNTVHPISSGFNRQMSFTPRGELLNEDMTDAGIGVAPGVAGIKTSDPYLWAVLNIPSPSVGGAGGGGRAKSF